MKITITGASGFVGQNLKRYLESDHEIEEMSVRYISGQTFNLKTDVLIHLAGKAHDLKKVSNPREYYEANYELTKQLFNSFLQSDVKVFVFMSTVKAVADTVLGSLTESDIPNPKTHYGIAKLQAEQYVLSKDLPYGKRVFILRPCMIHGPGNKGNLNLLYQLIGKGLPWPLGSFDNRRSFLSIENLCFVIKEILDNETISSGIYQVADNGTLSTNEIIELLGISLGKKANIWKVNPSFVRFVASLGDKIRFPLNTERLQKLTENYEVSNEKISSAIGKKFPVSVREGLLTTFGSFNLKAKSNN